MIDKKTWKPFQVNDIFEVLNGKGITKQEISDHQGELPAVQSGEKITALLGILIRNIVNK